MVKILFMAKETYSSTNALRYLCGKKTMVEIVGAVIRKNDVKMQEICNKYHIAVLSENEVKEKFARKELQADYIFSFYWKKVRKELLAIPSKGSINFHPGPLPESRGSGYHAAILQNWGYYGVTAHYMDEEFDTGPIIECRHFQISDKTINKDLVRIAHEQLYYLFKDIAEQIISGNILESTEQGEGEYFSLPELEESKLIREDESTEDIDRKIRAFWNPPYSGAQIEIKGKRYTVINEDILNWITQNLSSNGE